MIRKTVPATVRSGLPDTSAHTRVKPIVPSLRQIRGPPFHSFDANAAGAQRPRTAQAWINHSGDCHKMRANGALWSRGASHGGLMREDNSVGVVTGLVFVVLFLIMIGSIGSMTRIMQTASSAHDTAGPPPHGR
ncbi:MAG: hypothetical protein QOI12_3200 [Alphaproteobacteria bacterium]|jgi:hypothetical protein|nr:hypothetical protein [Alphaproteobacteria bacterium]